ncbi:uncharacterized protein K444DRAFT_346430 [Hyaloscypha bicolor E]|uniref:Secreted protein n=1 Tax=Hyaloscypha bicolor E TaxID=1095630 RepID=A0A2J6THW4_9HELO|nr:uncharacterized protein K444DRAFT_346430 [Hyaloscypha bicolor E]PMD62615.1 hypothetical protein K444DRAFT_346430 [Hyaloscypha bicolor E]
MAPKWRPLGAKLRKLFLITHQLACATSATNVTSIACGPLVSGNRAELRLSSERKVSRPAKALTISQNGVARFGAGRYDCCIGARCD